MNWSHSDNSAITPILFFELSKDERMREATNWINTQRLLKISSSA